MRQSVILAAGNGCRIQIDDPSRPKLLVEVAGRSLIEHALSQASDAGCEEVVLVLGKGADRILEHLESLALDLKIRVVFNSQPDLPNGVSLLKAEPLTDERFFLQMADHVFTRPVLNDLVQQGCTCEGCMRLLVDYSPRHFDEDDATKIRIERGRINAIGKALARWEAIDAGYFALDRRVFAALRTVEREEELSVSAGMRRLVDQDLLEPVALESTGWVDVDTSRDRDQAEGMLNGAQLPATTDTPLS